MLRSRTGLLFIFAILSSLVGCGGVGTPMGGYVDYDINDPDSIASWEASEYNITKAKIVVVELNCFGDTLGEPKAGEPTRVALHVEQARDTGVAPEQQKVIDGLIRDEAAIHSLVRDAVYEDYLSNYESIVETLEMAMKMFGGSRNDIAQTAPKISNGNELDSIMEVSISVHPVVGSKVSIGITLTTPWSDDDMGLRLVEGKIVAMGNAYEAFPPTNP